MNNLFSPFIFNDEIEYLHDQKWKKTKLFISVDSYVKDFTKLIVNIGSNYPDYGDELLQRITFRLFGKDVTNLMEIILFSLDELHIIRAKNTQILWALNDTLNEYGLNDESYFLTYVNQSDWLHDEITNVSFGFGQCYRIHLQQERIIIRTNYVNYKTLPKIVTCWPIKLLDHVYLMPDGLTIEFSVRNSYNSKSLRKFCFRRAINKDAKEIFKNINKLISKCTESNSSDSDNAVGSRNNIRIRRRNCNSSCLNSSLSSQPVGTYFRARTYSDNIERNRTKQYSPNKNYSFFDSLSSSFGVGSGLSESLKLCTKTTQHHCNCSTISTPSSSVINDRIIEETIPITNDYNDSDIFSNEFIDFKSFGANQELMFVMDNHSSANNDENCLNQTYVQNNQKLNDTQRNESKRTCKVKVLSNDHAPARKISLESSNIEIISPSISSNQLHPPPHRYKTCSSVYSSISSCSQSGQQSKAINILPLSTHRKSQSSSSSHRHYIKQNSVICTCKCSNEILSPNVPKPAPYSSSTSELSTTINQYNSISPYYNIYEPATDHPSNRFIDEVRPRHSIHSLNINNTTKSHDYYNLKNTISNSINNNGNNNNNNSYYNLQHTVSLHSNKNRDDNTEIIYAELDFDTIVPSDAEKLGNEKQTTPAIQVDSKFVQDNNKAVTEGPVNYTFISCENTEALNKVDTELAQNKSKKENSDKKKKKSKHHNQTTKNRRNNGLFGKFKELFKL